MLGKRDDADMVRRNGAGKYLAVLLILILVLCMVLLLFGLAFADEDEEEEKFEPTITDDYNITVNSVGDAQITNTTKYPDDLYDRIKNVVEDYPTFLSRRYTSAEMLNQVEKFECSMNDSENSATISYNSPGYVYNMQDHWAIYGYGTEPEGKKKKEFKFVSEYGANADYTLYTDQDVRRTTTIKLPKEAKNARFDSEAGAILYELPPFEMSYGFFRANKLTLSIIFGILAFIFACGLLFALTRKAPTIVVPQAAPPAAAGAITAGAAGLPGRKKGKKFCIKCGQKVAQGKKFCTRCGATVE